MKIYDRIAEILKNKSTVVFFELGACDGQQTLDILNMLEGKNLLYYAFEPVARLIPGIVSRTKGRVNIVNKAIGEKTGRAKFYNSINLNYSGSSSIRKPSHITYEQWPGMKFEEREVDVVSLDDFCSERQIDHIDFIWADIQGAEIDMIKGGQKILANTDYLYTEYNGDEKYEGCIDLKGIMSMLPGWSLVEDYVGDALLKNENVGV